VISPFLPSCWGFSFALGHGWGIIFCWNQTFSCWCLFSSKLQFWSSQRRRWTHILLLCHLPDVHAGFRKGRGTRDQIANIHWIIKKAREFQKYIYFCFIDYSKAFNYVDHNKLWKILKEMGPLPSSREICLPIISTHWAEFCTWSYTHKLIPLLPSDPWSHLSATPAEKWHCFWACPQNWGLNLELRGLILWRAQFLLLALWNPGNKLCCLFHILFLKIPFLFLFSFRCPGTPIKAV